ncbi:VOC family protein [Bacillus spongiae]|uniref:VOC family protein n=1 Tax=Bacillus spongiae TaxID=2683610 RepID=A0ABU8HIT5_9BACI
MKNPILNEIGAIFVPVRNIEEAREWYSQILGLPADGEIQFGHIYVLPMKGTQVVLDSKIYSPEKTFKAPTFHFNTENIEEAYTYMKNKEVDMTSNIEHNHYFTFKDPDGNHLMICKC